MTVKRKRCPNGYRWCPITKKCILNTEEDPRGKGRRLARGQGEGPIGTPYKEASDLVDMILDNNYSSSKDIAEVDRILDEVENQLDNVPDQDIESLHDDVVDELSKDDTQKEEGQEETSVEESMKNAVRLLISEEEYRDFFKDMLRKWNITSPSDLEGDKKKEFFNVVDKEWKAKKEAD
jgi:hypothetical protein